MHSSLQCKQIQRRGEFRRGKVPAHWLRSCTRGGLGGAVHTQRLASGRRGTAVLHARWLGGAVTLYVGAWPQGVGARRKTRRPAALYACACHQGMGLRWPGGTGEVPYLGDSGTALLAARARVLPRWREHKGGEMMI